MSVVTAALCLPWVTRATGIPAVTVIGIVLVHVVWTATVMFAIRPSGATNPARFHIALAGSVLVNTAIVIAFAALGSDPRTPVWMLPVMYACFNGSSQELDPSIGVLAIHVCMPIVAIPLMLARGADPSWSVAAPLLCSAVSAIGYNHLAQVSAGWREIRRDQQAALDALRANLDVDERARLAREIHDGLGSSLAIVGLYGDLVERHAERPDELRAIAAIVRDAAREGGAELSALFTAIMPSATDVDGVAAIMVVHGQRAAAASGTSIEVRVQRGGSVQLSGAVRLALVRVFQESVHNALRHGGGRNMTALLTADGARVSLELSDDGIGFTLSDVPDGHGLSGMRARATELGGTFTLTTSPGTGAQIRMNLPTPP